MRGGVCGARLLHLGHAQRRPFPSPQCHPPQSPCFGGAVSSTKFTARTAVRAAVAAVASGLLHRYHRVQIVRTQKGSGRLAERFRELPAVHLEEDKSGGASEVSVYVQANSEQGHPWLGVGGSFTEASAFTFGRMSLSRRREILQSYFDVTRGLRFNLGRVPIGSCDFSLESWSCGDLPEGDLELRSFSLRRYEDALLPMMRKAAEQRGSPLIILASPWSPPPWMKTVKSFSGTGRLKAEFREAWARHFVRFVQEMKSAGVPIWAVSVQNEPEAAQVWESCLYSAEEERIFVRDYLGPALTDAGLADVKILVWDHNREGMLERAAAIYNDPAAAEFVWGVAYHWYGDARFESWPPRIEVPFEDRQYDSAEIFELKSSSCFDNVRRVADLRPDKHLLFTEGCQELGGRSLDDVLGEWKLGERYAMNMISDINSGCEGWIDWNLVLDEYGGPNHVENLCVAPVICDTSKDEVLYQPAFWYLGHFSRFIEPGARRLIVSSSLDALEVCAMKNPDGKLVLVIMNQSIEDLKFWLKIGGAAGAVQATTIEAPARSIQTLVVDDGDDESIVSKVMDAVMPRSWREKLNLLWYVVGPREPFQKANS